MMKDHGKGNDEADPRWQRRRRSMMTATKTIHDDRVEGSPRWYATETIRDDIRRRRSTMTAKTTSHEGNVKTQGSQGSITKKAANMVYELDTKD